jgi:carbon-monoxide dehydrogenase medium subunit
VTPFELVEPRSLAEAVSLLDRDDPAVRAVGGGTALMLMMKFGVLRPRRLVSLRALAGRLASVEVEEGGELRLGAMVPLAVLERSALVRHHAPVLVETLRTLANVRVRNVATLGGHLAHGDPHMDLPPVLVALGARVVAAGPAGERTFPGAELVAGYFETTLAGDELLVEVIVPPQGGRRAAYQKCTARAAEDWPALGVAVSLQGSLEVVRDARIVVSAATERPMRLPAAEAVLRGRRPDDLLLRRAGEAAADEAVVIADEHGSAAYKRQLVRVHVARALRRALEAGAP